jgi:hypothetical protein
MTAKMGIDVFFPALALKQHEAHHNVTALCLFDYFHHHPFARSSILFLCGLSS